MARATKSVAAQAALADEQYTAVEQLEGQVDLLGQTPDDPESQGPVEVRPLPIAPDELPDDDYPEAGKTTGGKDQYAGLTEKQLRAKLYNIAERRIIEAHRDEFNGVADALFKEHGLTFQRKRTEKEKAADRIKEILDQHPELRPQFPGLALEADNEATPEGTHIA